ncbi:MAG: ribosomal protein S18-alanine N-acetyltransferase [Xanthomonadales bacterium]|nr:ribosomal protein S18-alanine N-acetyltransferase [Xanthomonadales bacterium]
MSPLIRPLWRDDLPAIIEIEQASYPFPWTEGIFIECIRAGYGCFGAQLEQSLAGYSVHNWGAGEAHLLNLCVDERWRRRGFGRMLLEHAIAHARVQGCTVMFLEVRPSNVDAGRLYHARGFREIGTRPAYYQAEGGREDALVMKLDLAS